MSVKIIVITEGATEREVGKVLYQRGILSRYGTPSPPDWRSIFGQSREGYNQVIQKLAHYPISPGQRILLVFDQEDAPTPHARADHIAQDLSNKNPNVWRSLSWNQLGSFPNLFHGKVNGACIVLHISNVSGPGITNKDFDGYILQLLMGAEKKQISSKITLPPVNPDSLLRKAEIEFPNLMQQNGFPWQRNKAWIYAYITAFQFRQSHVWFAKRVVECASENELRHVFRPLIYAWDWLVRKGDVCQ